jgi:hypothetical protein
VAATFPTGLTHYMIFMNVPVFTKIQLYDQDYRTDPNFERYDSSGWAYSASTQTLLVKMKHKNDVEHIRIYF